MPAWDLWPLVDAALKEITPGEGVGDFCCQGCSSRWLWHVMACYGSEDQGRMKNVYLKPPQLPTHAAHAIHR